MATQYDGRLCQVSRPRHPDKELELILKEAEDKGWRVGRGNKYYKMYCPCADQHTKTVKITPRSGYLRNLLGQLRRATCWEKMEGR